MCISTARLTTKGVELLDLADEAGDGSCDGGGRHEEARDGKHLEATNISKGK